jgi:hexosaminidase
LTYGEYIPLENVYRYEPVPKELNEHEAKYVLGSQANLWSEYINNGKLAEYMIFPRMTALSEVLWSEKSRRDSADFEKRLLTQFKRYSLWSVSYSEAFFDLKATVSPTQDYDGLLWDVKTKLKDVVSFNVTKIDTSKKGSWIMNPPLKQFSKPIRIKESSTVLAVVIGRKFFVSQNLFFNKATGKKITLSTEPSRTYQADGAFTLVNGVQNVKGMGNRKEFLGFNGPDCEATIDLGSIQQISDVKAHVLEVISNWIWRPKSMQVSVSGDGTTFTEVGNTDKFEPTGTNGNGIMTIQQPVSARYVKIKLENYGTIPENYVGAGNKAWLFVDEIEVN